MRGSTIRNGSDARSPARHGRTAPTTRYTVMMTPILCPNLRAVTQNVFFASFLNPESFLRVSALISILKIEDGPEQKDDCSGYAIFFGVLRMCMESPRHTHPLTWSRR